MNFVWLVENSLINVETLRFHQLCVLDSNNKQQQHLQGAVVNEDVRSSSTVPRVVVGNINWSCCCFVDWLTYIYNSNNNINNNKKIDGKKEEEGFFSRIFSSFFFRSLFSRRPCYAFDTAKPPINNIVRYYTILLRFCWRNGYIKYNAELLITFSISRYLVGTGNWNCTRMKVKWWWWYYNKEKII